MTTTETTPTVPSRFVLPAVAALFVALSVWLFRLDLHLRNDVAVNGIVSFELAANAERAGAIIASWDSRAREAAMLVQGLDYLYLLVYPTLLYLLAGRVGGRLGGAWQPAGTWVARAVLLCAPLDAIENHALIVQMTDGASDRLAHRAWLAAVPKFGLLFLATGFLLAGASVIVARRSRASRIDDRRGGRAV